MPTKLRTAATWKKYQKAPLRDAAECFICNKIKESQELPGFGDTYWIALENDFPYDAVAEKHILLCPKRCIKHENSLSEPELIELDNIKFMLEQNGEFDMIAQNFPVAQTHPRHLHYHIFKWIRV